jgi:beta-N-acetylhexosaminidase
MLQKAGTMRQLMHSFHGFTAPQEILDAVAAGHISAFCLFAYNVASLEQIRALTGQLHAAALQANLPPPIIGIDQEGGQLIAIPYGATELPGNMALGATRSPELAEKAGYVLARELLALGFNMNFSPSVDVNINPVNPVVGIRSFGDEPALVAQLGIAMIRGMQYQGVLASAKHFPGHGDTMTDSHHTVPFVAHDRERIDTVELYPFRAVIEAGTASIMTSHIVFKALDPRHPATISRRILVDLLRDELGYDGLVVTDAMDMHAVSRLGGELAVKMALLAGVDLALMGHLPDQMGMNERLRSLEDAASVRRIMDVRRQLPRTMLPLDVVGCAEHQAIAQEIADRSITLVRDQDQVLPLRPAADETLAVITVRPADLTPADTSSAVTVGLHTAIAARHPRVLHLEIPHAPDADQVRTLLAQLEGVHTIIAGTIRADTYPQQGELIELLVQQGKTVIAVALRTPYDVLGYPSVRTYLCAYGIRAVTTEAVARVLFGEIQAQGTLPCTIPGMQPTLLS